MLIARKLLRKGYHLFYDEKCFVTVDSQTRIYNRSNLLKENFSFKTPNAYWGTFLSDDEILVKSADGYYWFIDIVKQTSKRILPFGHKNADTALPVIEPGQNYLFDFSKDNCVSVLQQIAFDGTSRALYRLPVYGSSKLFRASESVLVITNSRGINEIKTKNRHELRRIEFNIQTGKVECEECCQTAVPHLCMDFDFAILRDGTVIRYNGELLDEKLDFSRFGLPPLANQVFYVCRLEKGIICFMYSDCVRIFDLQDPAFYKELKVPNPVSIIHYDDKLLIGTWEGVYQVLYEEVFS